MKQDYESEFKKKIVHIYFEKDRVLKSLAVEYGVEYASIPNWINVKKCVSSLLDNFLSICLIIIS